MKYECVPLRSSIANLELIKSFKIDREQDYSSDPYKVVGLEAYLKRCAWDEDERNEVRIYLVIDTETDELAAYFGLKSGMVVDSGDGMPSEEEKEEIMREYHAKLLPEVIPGIEISHFAINDNYRRGRGKDGGPVRGLGRYFYPAFVYPIIEDVAEKIGVGMIYLYAAGDDHLVHYYEQVFGFHALNDEDVFIPLEPNYDGGCTFMYQIL